MKQKLREVENPNPKDEGVKYPANPGFRGLEDFGEVVAYLKKLVESTGWKLKAEPRPNASLLSLELLPADLDIKAQLKMNIYYDRTELKYSGVTRMIDHNDLKASSSASKEYFNIVTKSLTEILNLKGATDDDELKVTVDTNGLEKIFQGIKITGDVSLRKGLELKVKPKFRIKTMGNRMFHFGVAEDILVKKNRVQFISLSIYDSNDKVGSSHLLVALAASPLCKLQIYVVGKGYRSSIGEIKCGKKFNLIDNKATIESYGINVDELNTKINLGLGMAMAMKIKTEGNYQKFNRMVASVDIGQDCQYLWQPSEFMEEVTIYEFFDKIMASHNFERRNSRDSKNTKSVHLEYARLEEIAYLDVSYVEGTINIKKGDTNKSLTFKPMFEEFSRPMLNDSLGDFSESEFVGVVDDMLKNKIIKPKYESLDEVRYQISMILGIEPKSYNTDTLVYAAEDGDFDINETDGLFTIRRDSKIVSSRLNIQDVINVLVDEEGAVFSRKCGR